MDFEKNQENEQMKPVAGKEAAKKHGKSISELKSTNLSVCHGQQQALEYREFTLVWPVLRKYNGVAILTFFK